MSDGSVTRREVLRAAVAPAAAALAGTDAQPQAAPAQPGAGFQHRCYLGWITDLASAPDPNAAWPSMRLDESLLADYTATFRAMKELGFTGASVWGLYVSRNWPVDLKSSVTPQRGALVERLIAAAHEQGIQVYCGLGVYSWGFEEIIRAYPKLSGGNPQALCGSEPEAWDWMRRVTDYAFTRFPIDGVSMQSADQGRCPCERCKRYGDTEYHARLNIRLSEYIRASWPGKTVAVSGWGMDFRDPAGIPVLKEMSRHLDYLLDVHDTSRQRDPAQRRRLTAALECAFGTLGGPQVEPPQHWERERWFLPTARGQGEHLASLYADGGRACEYFFHILRNPGDEVSFHVAGRLLKQPQRPWRKHLEETIARLYGTRPGVTEGLAQVFVDAEEAYFRHRSGATSTVSLEPLIGDRPGPPVYLKDRLDAAQRQEYRQDLANVLATVNKLAPEVPDKQRIARVQRCIGNVIAEIDRLA